MYELIKDYPLRASNTFKIDATAKQYLKIDSSSEPIQFFKKNRYLLDSERLFLGAGSNLLFVKDYQGLVIHPVFGGISVIKDEKSEVEVECGAGISWDYFVSWCVENDLQGVENLSLIPGNIGAVPVQNIGAYGTEASSIISEVKGIDLNCLEELRISHTDCKFGYRTSLFKEILKESFLVTSVVFRLSRLHNFKIHHEGLEEMTNRLGGINLQNIRKAIIAIRESKLPDPAIYGNAGSFFKNPIVRVNIADKLKNNYPEIPLYPIDSDNVKVAAGWLIEKAGWKGKSLGRAAIHSNQALVIINTGGATGEEIFRLSQIVAQDIVDKFDITLEPEVQVI